jgi:hypothetical protein
VHTLYLCLDAARTLSLRGSAHLEEVTLARGRNPFGLLGDRVRNLS